MAPGSHPPPPRPLWGNSSTEKGHIPKFKLQAAMPNPAFGAGAAGAVSPHGDKERSHWERLIGRSRKKGD